MASARAAKSSGALGSSRVRTSILPLKIVDGGAVGQHYRGVDGGQMDVWGKGAVGFARWLP